MKPKPCPFCGSDKIITYQEEPTFYDDRAEGSSLTCRGCGILLTTSQHLGNLLMKWNRRSKDESNQS